MKKEEKIVENLTTSMRNEQSLDLTKIIERLTSLELRDRDGRTLLINASFYNRLDIVEWLIYHGAEVNASDKTGNTSLHAAVQEGNVFIMRFLLEHGADVNSKNVFGNTPLWMAKPMQSKEIFEILLSFGADPDIKNNYGMSAADCMAAYPDIIEIFQTKIEDCINNEKD